MDWDITQADVATAFLNAPISTEVYLRIPPCFDLIDAGFTLDNLPSRAQVIQHYKTAHPKGKVLRLRRCIYGLKNSPREWYITFHSFIISLGFTQNIADPCIYILISDDYTVILAVYVDDIIAASSSPSFLAELKQALDTKFGIKDMGDVSWILGASVHRDRAAGITTLSQQAYINDLVLRFAVHDRPPRSLPLPSDFKLYPEDTSPVDCSPAEREIYKSLLGSLIYASILTRPDIATAVSQLGRVQQQPTTAHLSALQGVLLYLKGTASLGLTYKRGSSPSLTLVGYCDASYADSAHEERRCSTEGFLFLLLGPISWYSKLQAIVTLSSTEAEYVALTEAFKEAIHLRQLLSDLRLLPSSPTPIFEDNQATLHISKAFYTSRRTKHISVRYHWIRQEIENGVAALEFIPTKDQLADIFTKNLGTTLFHHHREHLLSPACSPHLELVRVPYEYK